MSAARCLSIAVLLTTLGACIRVPVGHYKVVPVREEVVADKMTAQWFSREITGAAGLVSAVELVYCPIIPGAPVVCRTAIVWERDHSKLIQP